MPNFQKIHSADYSTPLLIFLSKSFLQNVMNNIVRDIIRDSLGDFREFSLILRKTGPDIKSILL